MTDVSAPTLTRLAMAVAGVMLAHQVASKAFREATFLSAWRIEDLPTMVIAAAVCVVVAVPVYARLLAAFGPRRVVPIGFLLSAAAHVVEWRVSPGNRWIAVAIYLHAAGFGALLLSGFWLFISELFDPRSAKASFGPIAAAGTLGGLAGGIATVGIAATLPVETTLLLLAGLHTACAAGAILLGRASHEAPPAAPDTAPRARWWQWDAVRAAPHLGTLALIVIVTSGGAAIVDYLFKAHAKVNLGDGPDLLRFFAIFYAGVQVATFAAQASVGSSVRRLGLGATISSLPVSLGITSTIALVIPAFQTFIGVRAAESVFRGSLFRGAYELLFVPMDPDQKRRTKTFLDVTCDRAGDALGSGLVKALLLLSPLFAENLLLACVLAAAAIGIWLSRRLDVMYVRVVERRLVGHAGLAPVILGTETGWTRLDIARPVGHTHPGTRPSPVATPPRPLDPRLEMLVELRSGDRSRVEAALLRLTNPDTTQVAQVIQLLAWDDLVVGARKVLESAAPGHVGLLVDELLDGKAEFAIRRRIPRILGTVPSARAVDGLVRGLDDPRFEVRYQCARALGHLVAKNDGLRADAPTILAVVERELSVSPQIWHGHQLIDAEEHDDEPGLGGVPEDRAQRNLEHVFWLLSAVLPREPLQVAFGGIRSRNAELRGLALEYLDSVLPLSIRLKLWSLLDAKLEDRRERVTPERALEQLRQSASLRAPMPGDTSPS